MLRRILSGSLAGATLSLVAIAGCTAPIPEGRFACNDDSQCPPGQSCDLSDHLCRTGGGSNDSGIDAAALPDSGGGDTGAPDTGGADTGLDTGSTTPDGGTDGGSDSGCSSTAMCDDGQYCNGAERCSVGVCIAGTLPCTGSQTCNERNHTCSMATCTTDADSDGFVAASCGGPDCNDAAPNIHPGQRELCDNVDNDCNGTIDDNAAPTCPGHAGTTPACTAGTCAYTCVSPLLTCDSANPADATGCEVDPTRDTSNCGSCGRVCTPASGQTASCTAAGCSFACGTGRLDCDGVASNGCETPGTTCDIAPPRPIGPMDEMVVTSNRPTFRFAPAPGTTDAHVEICMDEACATVVQSVDGPSPLTASAMLAPGHYFWRAHARVGTYNATRASFAWGFSTFSRATTTIPSADAFPYLDVDHGMPDLIIGSPTMNGGTARLYLGATPSGATPFIGGAQGFGSAVAIAGDVNGDGFGDVVIGACIGSWANGALPTPSMGCASQAFYYQSVGDGTFAAPVMLPSAGFAGFGNAVSSAGDFNGDGYGDVVIGAYYTGRATIFRGSATGIDASSFNMLGVGSTTFGTAVALAGDVNADGHDDVIVGQPSVGRAFLYLGQTALGVPLEIAFGTGLNGYGASVSGIGDFNGDGYADFAVSTVDTPGTVEIRIGGPTISATSPPAVFATVNLPVSGGATGGASVTGFGDCNGDGLMDLASGSYAGTPNGTVSVFRGSMGGVAPPLTFTNPANYFGRVVSRLAGPTLTTAACSATGACSQRVDQLTCSSGTLTLLQTWMDPSQQYFGAGLMR